MRCEGCDGTGGPSKSCAGCNGTGTAKRTQADLDAAADVNGHTWSVDEDGVCEYDQGYLCPCGARKVEMAEGDTQHTAESRQLCPLAPEHNGL